MLPEELMSKVRELEIRSRRSVSEVFAGEYSSAFRGRGMEFSEVREYQPGDDIRTIDWNVTARMDGAYVKRYVEERELTVVLCVDRSASGLFASRRRLKQEAAVELCAIIAFAATKKNDKVGLLAYSDGIEQYIPPKKGLRHVLRIIRELLEDAPARSRSRRGTDTAGAMRYLNQVLRRRAIVALVSDFLEGRYAEGAWNWPEGYETALRLASRRHDLLAAQIVDPHERSLPRAGLLELADTESGRRIMIDSSSRAVRRRFESAAGAHDRALREALRRAGADHIAITPTDDCVHALMELFHRRERRR